MKTGKVPRVKYKWELQLFVKELFLFFEERSTMLVLLQPPIDSTFIYLSQYLITLD